jgi:hypothetical protein
VNSTTYTVNLPWEFVDHIIKTELSSTYKTLVNDINDLNTRDQLSSVQMQDLEHNIACRDAFRIVLSYYTTSDELVKLLETE